MRMIRRLVTGGRWLRRQAVLYQMVRKDPRTPRLAKWLLASAMGYLLLPFDVIPDWIPVLGYVDDVIIVPGLVMLARKFVPNEVLVECAARLEQIQSMRSSSNQSSRDRT